MKSASWAFAVWALVAASVLAWGFRLFVGGRAAPAHTVVAGGGAALRADLGRVFGNDPQPEVEAAPPPNARFHLVGVLAPRSVQDAEEGVALIAIDGRPPKAYRIGAPVEGELVLQSVRARGAELGPRGGVARVALEITPPPPAATGALPSAAALPSPLAPPNLAPPPGVRLPTPGPSMRAGGQPRPLPPPGAEAGQQQPRPETSQTE